MSLGQVCFRPKMQRYVIRLLLALVVLAITGLVAYFFSVAFASYAYLRDIYALIALVGGVVFWREIAVAITDMLRPRLRKDALIVGNAVSVCGFIFSAFVAATFASISSTTILASAAVGGIVLGLALQPTLGSFFAGLLILGSGAVRPGTHVRILSWHIPFQWAFMPAYKYFSPDSIYAGYMGQVVQIGLFFTTIATEEGQVMKIPNTILATDAAIVSYTERDYVFNVRYEFSIKFEPEKVLKLVSTALKGYPVISIFINEQSDKQYYILKIVLNAKEQDHAVLKSEILSKIIGIHNRLQEATAA
jgi:small-conductance mechanosensitive channel